MTDCEFREIKEKIIADVKNLDSGNVGITDGYVDDRDEDTGGVSCPDADTRVARTRYVDQRENVNHTRALDDILIVERSEDEFKIVGEGNHVSYDTIGNDTIMYHPSFNENSKANSNPKKPEKVIELEKKTMMLSIFRLQTKLLKLLVKN